MEKIEFGQRSVDVIEVEHDRTAGLHARRVGEDDEKPGRSMVFEVDS
jgi:hypothetical protein